MHSLLLLIATASAWTQSTGTVWPGNHMEFTINNQGSRSLPNLDNVERIMLESMEQWSSQTCTSFSWSYQGRTGGISTNNGNNATAYGFTSSWPRNYGDPYSVIGLTMAMFNWGETTETDVSFNEQVWTFVDGTPANWSYQADLQSIATHEFGHVLGLGHTNRQGSTMVPSYDNTLNFRTLGNDDIDGVCGLYPGSGGSGDWGPAGGGGGGGTTPGGGQGGGTTDDAYEPNDDVNAARALNCGDLITGTARNEDWFRVRLSQTGPLDVTLTWTDRSVDLDLYVFDDRDEVGRSIEPAGNIPEVVNLNNQAAGDYWIAIDPWDGQDDYTLAVDCGQGTAPPTTGGGGGGGGTTGGNDGGGDGGGTGGNDSGDVPPKPDDGTGDGTDPNRPTGGDDQYEDNDVASTATPVDCGSHIRGIAADEDWFVFETTAEGPFEARLSWDDILSDLDLYLVDTKGLIASSEVTEGTDELLQQTLQPGVYALIVNPWSGAEDYNLYIACDGVFPEGYTPADELPSDVPAPCACNGSPAAPLGLPLMLLGFFLRRRDDRHDL